MDYIDFIDAPAVRARPRTLSHVFTLYLYPDEKSYRWCSILDTMACFTEEYGEPNGGEGDSGPDEVFREFYMTGIRFDTVECERVAVFLLDAVEIEPDDEDDWCASRRVKSWGFGGKTARQVKEKLLWMLETFGALLGAGEIRLDPELSPDWPDHFTVADVDELVAHIRSEELEDNGNIGFRGRPQDLATIGWPLIDGRVYRLSVHGHEAGDWEIPHLHLDRADDLERRSFSFEISLVALLATGEPALLRQKDLYAGFAGIARTGTECRWDGYERLRDGLLAYLEAGPEGAAPRCSRSNLESAIIAWNKERGPDPHALADYLREHGVSVLDKYGKYFPSLPRQPRPDSPAS